MNANKMKERFDQITTKQLELANTLYGPSTKYARLLKAYTMWSSTHLCQKHYTHDAVFFIVDEGMTGFRTVKFYFDSTDYRVGSSVETMAEAYNEAIHVL